MTVLVDGKSGDVGGLTVGKTYYVDPVSTTDVKLIKSFASLSGLSFDQISSQDDEIVADPQVNFADFGFAAGQQITITARPAG